MVCCALLELLLLLSVADSLNAQTATRDSVDDRSRIKVQTRLVQVDVVVTKEKDQAVPGLRKEDFQILEDGDAQTISFFEEHKGVAPTRVELAPTEANEFSNYPTSKSVDTVNVLMIDALNTQPKDQAYVHAQIVKYLQSVPPGTRIGIFVLGTRLKMIRGVTDDSPSLVTAFTEKAGTGPELTNLLTTDFQKAAEKLAVDTMVKNDSADSGIDALRDYQKQDATRVIDTRLGATLLAFQQLARYLSPFAGRKNLIWISGSFPVNFSPRASSRGKNASSKHQYQRNIQATTDLLAEYHIAVYPIGATGLAINNTYNVDNSGRPISEENTEFSSNQTAMENLATSTGGKAYYNMNSLAEATSKAVDHGSRYYSIAYTPKRGEMDGKYRQIEVKLVGHKYKLIYRRGYYADDAAMPQEADLAGAGDPLLPLLGFGMPDFSQVIFNVHVGRVDPQPDPNSVPVGANIDRKQIAKRYRLDFAMPAQSVTLKTNADGVHEGGIEVILIAYDSAGKPMTLVGKTIRIVLPPGTYETLLQSGGFQFHEDIDLLSGDLYLRAGIYDLTSTHAGTLGFPLRVAGPN